MEHDLRYLLGDGGDDENSLESYLRRKDKEECPPSQLPVKGTPKKDPVPTQAELLTKYPGLNHAPAAVGNSSPAIASPIPADELPQRSAYASGAVEHVTELSIHKHSVVGSYISEEVKVLVPDADYMSIVQKTAENPEKSIEILVQDVIRATFTTQFDTLKATPEQVIEHFHKMDRCIFLIRGHQGALRNTVLEAMLSAETATRRAELLELDRKHRGKVVKKAADGEAKPKRPSSTPKGSLSKGRKAAKALHAMQYEKADVIVRLQAQNLYDEDVKGYVEQLFA